MPTLTLGTSAYGTISTIGEHDTFTITLVAGQTYDFRLHGVGINELSDPFLRLYNSSGTLVGSNDDAGTSTWGGENGQDSRLVFTASTSGTYTVDVSHFLVTGTGDYLLTAATYNSSGMVFTDDEIAWQLVTNGENYFGNPAARFNVGTDNSLTVNITGLTTQGQYLARQALLAWTNVTGIQFIETSGVAEITFDDSDSGSNAYTNTLVVGNTITSASVMITTGWLAQFGTTLNSYSFETYIHEIGHALGLAHGGNYNGTAVYGTSNYYLNDSLAYSIMSYMQANNDEFGAPMVNTFVNASFRYILSPQIADIIAIQSLYGDLTTHYAGNTTYGFGSNTGNTALDSAVNYGASMAFTIFDEGGTDTLNFSNYSGSQIFDLHSESLSSVLGGRLNLGIARGVTIENVNGGSGNDTIYLSSDNVNNVINGNGGSDTVYVTYSYGSGYTIQLGSTAANLVMVGSAGTDTFQNDEFIHFANGTTVATSSLLGSITTHTPSDFNGDHISDILWRNDNGTVTDWLMNNGQYTGSGYGYSVSNSWSVAGTGDFNGDGTTDILWRNSSTGIVTDWLMNNGQYTGSGYGYSISNDWSVVGTGDFNGDGTTDILWRNSSTGIVTDWLMNNGQYTGSGYGYSISNSWSVVGTGDFNGDGTTDILWRNNSTGVVTDWLMNNGQYTGSGYGYSISTDWSVAGTGDFNGDGTTDILWRNSNTGVVTDWLMHNGQYTGSGYGYSISTDWSVVGTGDYNGDHTTDILWRNSAGTVTDWLMSNGQYTGSGYGYSVANTWHVVSGTQST